MNASRRYPRRLFVLLFLLAGLGIVRGLASSRAADDPAAAKPAAADAFFNVRAYGATGDGKTLDSPAIDRAIDAAAQAGGGTVHLPAGSYLCGSIHLKSNIHLLLDAGATIVGAPQAMKAYDVAEPFEGKNYQDGGHTYFHNSLIWGEDFNNVSITGQGTIDGGGLGSADNDMKPGPVDHGDKAIALKRCRNVLLRDITIIHGGHFAILATGCDGMTVDNVTMDTNRDGIDIDCCRNVMVSNCRVNSPEDDGICPKSTFALGEARITENLTITNCQVSAFKEGTLLDGTMVPNKKHKFGRIKFGTESNGGFRNITITNCTFRNCHGLALEEVDGGIMENITISNITMMEVAACPIYITLGSRNRGPEGTQTGSARNILISNVIATGIDRMSGVQITGAPGHPIDGVRLENVRLVFKGGGTSADAGRVPQELSNKYPEPDKQGTMPSYAVFARHVSNLELANFRVSYEEEDVRPAIMCVDADGVEIDNFKPQLAAGVPGARFEQVKNLVIRNSPALAQPAAEGK